MDVQAFHALQSMRCSEGESGVRDENNGFHLGKTRHRC